VILTIPAALDPHVHLRDLDWVHKASIASETSAALAGGYWAVFDMPNTPPATINRAALDLKLERFEASACCDWGVYAGASQRDNTADYAAMIDDVVGLKIYNNATTGDLLIVDQGERNKHYQAWAEVAVTLPLIPRSVRKGGITRPIAVHAEDETVAQILELVRRHRVPTHFCHISTGGEIDLLRAAKREGLPISVGVTPHHLYLNDDDLPRLGAYGLMKPELKTRADQTALWAGLADGTVDIVESDHAPHTRAEKDSDRPPYGVPGLETTIPLLALAVHERRITPERLIELVAVNPRRIFGVTPPADTWARVDLSASVVIGDAPFYSAAGVSPFAGLRVYGRVIENVIRGRVVYDGGRVIAAPRDGRRVR